MIQVNRFAIGKHSESYDSRPRRSRLIVDGLRTNFFVPGYALLHHFETPSCYLLVTDYDCPFEESVYFIAVSKDIRRTLDSRCVGAPYASYLLKDIQCTDERHFFYHFRGSKGPLVILDPRSRNTFSATKTQDDSTERPGQLAISAFATA